MIALVEADEVEAADFILPTGHAADVAEIHAQLSEVGHDGVGGNTSATASATEEERTAVLHAIRRGRNEDLCAVGGDARDVEIIAVFFGPGEVSGLHDF